MGDRWYVLRSKYQKEPSLLRYARDHGHTLFHPRIRISPKNPRARTIKPLFPGYMFVKTDISSTGLSAFRWMPFSLGLVTFGGQPAPVPDNLIDELRLRSEQSLAGEETIDIGLKPGDPVRVTEGLFSGYEGFFDGKVPGRDRVKVLLALLSDHYKLVELELAQLEY